MAIGTAPLRRIEESNPSDWDWVADVGTLAQAWRRELPSSVFPPEQDHAAHQDEEE